MPISQFARCHVAGAAGALLILLIPIVATAQYSTIDDPPPRFEWRGQVEALFRTEFKTRTDGGDSFESWTSGASGQFGGPINESILVGLEAGYQYAHYNFRLDNAPGVPSVYGGSELPRDPWGAINTLDLAPATTILVGNQFSVVAAVPIRFSAETGSRRNGFTAGLSALVRWQITETFRIGAGIGFTSQLEDHTETFPVVSLDWKITEALEVRTEGNFAQGGLASLFWGPNQAIRLSLSAGYERNRFRLDDNGFAADRHGIGEVTAVPLEAGLRIRLYEGAYFDFRLGLAVAGRFRIENNDGRKLYEQNYDPSPRLGLSLTLPFSLPARETSTAY